ncbi:hypothetical protein NYQ66_03665 [Aquibacillus koreensis]|nr:hypothetical protein [Aquibacillus koreensis]MCT2534877.1 hypothetical protein [Aquibacillus koreensis]
MKIVGFALIIIALVIFFLNSKELPRLYSIPFLGCGIVFLLV